MSDASKTLIFGSILRAFLGTFEGGIVSMTDDIVAASIEVFATIARDLLPTPSKSHYTFNLRDLAKVPPHHLPSKEEGMALTLSPFLTHYCRSFKGC